MTPPERKHGGEEAEEAEQPSIADGGGARPPPPPPPPRPGLALARRKRFVLFGDSITQQGFSAAQGGWGARLADAYARKVKEEDGVERESP